MTGDAPEVITGCRPNLLVADLSTSLRFYADALGFHIGWLWSDRQSRFLTDIDPGEPGTALVGRDRAQIMLTQVPGPHTTRLHLDIGTSSPVDQLFTEWSARAVPITEPQPSAPGACPTPTTHNTAPGCP